MTKYDIMIEALNEVARKKGYSGWYSMKQSIGYNNAKLVEECVGAVLEKVNWQGVLA